MTLELNTLGTRGIVNSVTCVQRVSLVYSDVDSAVSSLKSADLDPIKNSSYVSSTVMNIFVLGNYTNTGDNRSSMLLDVSRVFIRNFPCRPILLVFFT